MEPSHDVWSPLATLLANLIEKYASELDLENLPDPDKTASQKQLGVPVEKRAEL